ncbi:tRNA(fMet)-specific endonuclease VapC [Achromobacter sp. Marseille-Q0513]|uniref:type II toxin-antitoxin system tRNA(fMet)-specific endonuclease VapC n=1 Tax=Achromobacter sp. Marseille-Q0513 TaxID=2829161 RepID=UPI001BA26121|nr:tRNA(fMet)-specific endonuclease VapC [Achromobacter sp. Marseille-Q0513]MBR8654636.1 tRNA(fMet)-specific endonuclease VapC [Achromobacter sp. Marseille-Q0513]
MTLRFVLDTNICIFAIKNKPSNVRQALNRRPGQLCVSAITAMELRYGAEKSATPARNHAVIDGFLKRLEVLNYDRAAATHAGRLRAELARAGTPIGPYDAMIAGHARSRGFVLVTNNTREFSRVSGLRLDDWTQ